MSLSTRPLAANRIATVPSDRCGTDCIEDAHPCGRSVRHLDHRAGVSLVVEIDEAAARAVALLADRVAGGQGTPVGFVIVLWPARPMLHALMARGEEVAIHAGSVAALLDQLELDVPGVGQGDGDMHIIVTVPGVREGGDGQAVRVEPGSDAADLNPVAHRGLDVAHDDAHLTHVSEQTAHL